MPSFLLLTTAPTPVLTLAAPPRAARRRGRLLLLGPLAAASSSSSRPPRNRRVYRRQRAPPTPGTERRAYNVAGDEEGLEEAIFEFMCRSDKPGAFPTRAELVAAGRTDLAVAVDSCEGWLSLGWPSDDVGMAAEIPSGAASKASAVGVHPDYPPEAGASDLAPGAAWASRDGEASPSGQQPETEETTETGSGAVLEGMLSRLQSERERARPLPRSSTGAGGHQGDNDALMGDNSGAPGRCMTGDSDAWRTWSLDKGGFSDFQAAEVCSTNSTKPSALDGLGIVHAQDDVHLPWPSNGVAIHDYGSNGVNSEKDDINARLQNLEFDLTAALTTLRSRFDKVISDMSEGGGANVPNGISDDWEFEETKVMHAQKELRSIRAKIAVLEGKMALEIIEKNKIIEEKQRRLDEAEKALSELRTVYIVWSNPASEVLLTGSFDGWTSQVSIFSYFYIAFLNGMLLFCDVQLSLKSVTEKMQLVKVYYAEYCQ
ncbi:hypothetical protein GUJ93_ZPchr0013g35974 [Zizania palustris]|uniref:AMP-activated protein kinase glycogen-binding domain-containing protein n=1 Tax=Zizania palustris TaxID=103762 RepID=A0A8J5WVC6_ZIZPA|nr:hypothetical protein GUJ93_ZPchr0013g35974 [Zizania palustris]